MLKDELILRYEKDIQEYHEENTELYAQIEKNIQEIKKRERWIDELYGRISA